jgi:hypothetical protein
MTSRATRLRPTTAHAFGVDDDGTPDRNPARRPGHSNRALLGHFSRAPKRGTVGVFKPLVYKGEFCYEKQQRVLCELADGTTAFEDELPEDATVLRRRTVTTRGEQLGVYKKDTRALWAAILKFDKLIAKTK